jgi:mycothiol synthase
MEQPQLVMVRPTLEGIPKPELPAGYRIRFYEPGDEDRLEEVFQKCFDPGWSRDRIVKTFMDQVLWSPQRMLILCHDTLGGASIPACPQSADRNVCAATMVVGTATAWEGSAHPGHAMLHYVAVHPHDAGRGLGLVLVCRTLKLMRSFGYRDAWLSTDDWRLPAIVVYLRCGFEPVFDHGSHTERWEIVRHKLIAAGRDVTPIG